MPKKIWQYKSLKNNPELVKALKAWEMIETKFNKTKKVVEFDCIYTV